MGDVTAVGMDVVTEKSGHSMTPLAVSVCLTPAAPSPLPIPYPVTAMSAEGITDPAMRTKVGGSPVATVGSCLKACHGNEPGTLKEVVSLNTGGPSFLVMGAPIVICELGMMGITGSPGFHNKAITVGAPANASDASGTGGPSGSGAVAGSASGDAQSSQAPTQAAGSSSASTSTAASAAPPSPTPEEVKLAKEPGDSPEKRAAREKVARDFYARKGEKYDGALGKSRPFKLPEEMGDIEDHMSGIDLGKPVAAGPAPPLPKTLDQVHVPERKGQYFAKEGVTPEQLSVGRQGIDPRTKAEVTKSTDTYEMPPDGPYLNSTASKKDDTWSVPGKVQPGEGGGEQYYVPDQSKTTNKTGSP